MRLVNEKKDAEPSLEPVNLLSLPFYALLCGLGFSSLLMSPFAVILVHRRFPDFWPKVVSIAGALIALLLLEVPVPVVLLSFVLAVFVADSIQRQVPMWTLLARAALLSSFMGIVGLLVASRSTHLSDLTLFWGQLVDKAIQQGRESQLLMPNWDLQTLRNLLFYQGPFYFLSGCLLSVWFSIGLAAHLKWQADADAYSSQSLRGLKLPWPFLLLVFLTWVGNAFNGSASQNWIAGLLHLFFVVVSMQGVITLSIFMAQKGWRNGIRAAVYVSFLLVGFYALVGFGLMSPFVFIKKKSLIECQTKPLEEAV